MESDIAQEFLDRMERNLQALREGGAKAVMRFSYKHDDSNKAQPWEATPEWIKRHIDQLAPYWQEYTDVILCLQAGFIGPLAKDLAPHRLAPAGIGNGKVQTVRVYAMPVAGGDKVT